MGQSQRVGPRPFMHADPPGERAHPGGTLRVYRVNSVGTTVLARRNDHRLVSPSGPEGEVANRGIGTGDESTLA